MTDKVFDLVHGNGNARNSEGAFLRTASGHIRFVYSRYTGEEWHDGATADLAEVYSDDGGDTWKNRGVVIPHPERGYCYTAMEFLGGGELLLAYCCGRHLDGDSNLQDLRIRKLNVNELWKN